MSKTSKHIIVQQAMKIVSEDVIIPKCIRDGKVKKENKMNKIPTAEEFFEQEGTYPKLAIKFAKLHVKAALKAASESYLINETNMSDSPSYLNQCILDAYPLTNIK